MRHCVKKEVNKLEFDLFLKEQGESVVFDGMRYTVPVKMRGITWNKPIAYLGGTEHDRKYFIVTDL